MRVRFCFLGSGLEAFTVKLLKAVLCICFQVSGV